MSRTARVCLALVLMVAVSACASMNEVKMKMTTQSVDPGTSVTMQGKPYRLLGEPLKVGKPLPSVELIDAMTMKPVDLSKERGSILLISVVVSTDTPVCEEQTHYLGEQGSKLPASVKRIVISRDTPFAQKRFAKEAHLENLQYLSDYKTAPSGRPRVFSSKMSCFLPARSSSSTARVSCDTSRSRRRLPACLTWMRLLPRLPSWPTPPSPPCNLG